ncbi:unnamed protein product [Gadus morhua 'NCC']
MWGGDGGDEGGGGPGGRSDEGVRGPEGQHRDGRHQTHRSLHKETTCLCNGCSFGEEEAAASGGGGPGGGSHNEAARPTGSSRRRRRRSEGAGWHASRQQMISHSDSGCSQKQLHTHHRGRGTINGMRTGGAAPQNFPGRLRSAVV